ncbi:MAG: hypothetical protein GX768_06425 [Chloroflexi bacterium]|jgi:hypothetical protein|nr:hypothetical protein [Chloroflexota bacterium]
MTENEVKKVVTRLMGKDVLSYRLREDGFLVVVNRQGWKVTFSPTEVEKAHQSRRSRPETSHD